MRRNAVLKILHTQFIYYYVWKTVTTTSQCIVGLRLRGYGHEMKKNCGTNPSHSFPCFSKLLPRIGVQQTSKCGSESSRRMMTYIFCLENCEGYILTHSCLPIVGTLFYNVRKFYGPRIWECNLKIWLVLIIGDMQFKNQLMIINLLGEQGLWEKNSKTYSLFVEQPLASPMYSNSRCQPELSGYEPFIAEK